jgi:hypothetical protein
MWHKNYWRWLFVRMSGGKYIPLYGEYWDNVQETKEYPSAQIIHEIQEDIRALESAVAYAALCSYRGIIYNEDKNALTYYDSVIKQYKTKLTALQEIS